MSINDRPRKDPQPQAEAQPNDGKPSAVETARDALIRNGIGFAMGGPIGMSAANLIPGAAALLNNNGEPPSTNELYAQMEQMTVEQQDAFIKTLSAEQRSLLDKKIALQGRPKPAPSDTVKAAMESGDARALPEFSGTETAPTGTAAPGTPGAGPVPVPPAAGGGSGSGGGNPWDMGYYGDEASGGPISVTTTKNGKQKVVEGTVAFDENAAWGFINNAKRYGSLSQLQQDLYWAGFYGENAPIISGTDFNRDDLEAVGKMLDQANANARDPLEMVALMSDQGRAQMAPLGQELKQKEDPTYQLRQLANKNGIKLSNDYIATASSAIVAGQSTLDQELQRVRDKFVVNAYPAWADEIKQGQNVEDLAAPYIDEMSRILEIPTGEIELNDPTLQKAIQGADANGKPSYTPLWAFKAELRKDPRWQYTTDAYTRIGNVMDGVMTEMGF